MLLAFVDCCSCAMLLLFSSVTILESSSQAFPPWSCSVIASSNIQPSSSVAINPCASNLDKGLPDWPYGSHTFVGRFAVGSGGAAEVDAGERKRALAERRKAAEPSDDGRWRAQVVDDRWRVLIDAGGVAEVDDGRRRVRSVASASTLTFGHIDIAVDGRRRVLSVRSSVLCIRCRPIMRALLVAL